MPPPSPAMPSEHTHTPVDSIAHKDVRLYPRSSCHKSPRRRSHMLMSCAAWG
jgi:hypothetical protein